MLPGIISNDSLYNMEEPQKERIDISDRFSLYEWCELLNCSEKDLLIAIRKVGNETRMVDDYLEENRRKFASGMDL